MADNWRSQAIPTEQQSWRNEAQPVSAEPPQKLPPKLVGSSKWGVSFRNPQEKLLDSTSVGRVLDAFGEGAAEGWGSAPLGLSPESEQWLKDHKVFANWSTNWKQNVTQPLRAFNEGLIRPAAQGVDAFFRLFPAAARGAANALGQAGVETGLLQDTKSFEASSKQRFVDSLDEFIQVGGIVAGGEATYMGTSINKPRVQRGVDGLKEAVKEPAKAPDPMAVPPPPGFEVWHGSPHVFDAFDLKKIGSGEGSQMEGWGLYVADEKLVATQYRQALAEDRAIVYPDGFAAPNHILHSLDMLDFGSGKLTTADIAAHARKQAEISRKWADNDSGMAADVATWESIAKMADDGEFKINHDKRGALYQARINAAKEDFLDLDATIQEQSPQVKERLQNLANELAGTRFGDTVKDALAKDIPVTGRGLYDLMVDAAIKELEKNGGRVDTVEADGRAYYRLLNEKGEVVSRDINPEKTASEMLNKAGIKGNKYFDQKSRDAKSGTRNYVLFDDSVIQIEKRNDVPVAAAAKKPEQLAQPLPPKPVGISPEFVTSSGTIDTAKINELSDVYGAIEELSQSYPVEPLATRGTVSWAQTEELAQVAGVTPDVLLSRGIGDAWNAHQLEAARNLLIQTSRELIEASRKARATGSDADTLAAVEAWNKAALANEAVTGLKTEAGRALNILKKHKQQMAEVEGIKGVLDELGGKASMDEILEALKKMDNEADPAKVNKFIRDMNKPGAKDMVLEYLYNAMLSNPVTHGANLLGNSLALMWEPVISLGAGTIGAARAAVGSKSALAGHRAFMGEAPAMLWGMVQGFPEGLRLAWRAIQDGKPSSAGKMETSRYRLVTGPDGKIHWLSSDITQAIPNPKYDLVYNKAGEIIQEAGGETVGIGSAIRTPTTMLMAADEMFKAMSYRASLNAQAYRAAAKKKLTGQAFTDEVNKLVQNPTKKMMETAKEKADYTTFTRELGTLGKQAQRFLTHVPTLKFLTAPFFRTPINLIKHPLEHSPLSLFSRSILETAMGKNGKAARDEVYARILMGSGVIASAGTLALMGKMTGAGPKDPAERAVWLLAGNQPYSVRIGDRWISYARLEPFATLLGISADAASIADQVDLDTMSNIGTLVAYSASQNIMNKTWLKGITDIVEAVNDPDRYGDRYIQSILTRSVPAASAQLARMDDPYLRDARTILDAFAVKVPGKSTEVYPKRDIFGNAIKREGSLGPDIVSPIFQTQINKDPVVQELMALNYYPAQVDRKIRGVELTDQQYDEYQRAAGQLLYQSLKMLINVPGWNEVPPGIRTEIFDKQLYNTREQARNYMLMKYPEEILGKSIEQKFKHLTGEQ